MKQRHPSVALVEIESDGSPVLGELLERWHALKTPRWRRRTARYYRDAIDLVLVPRFGHLDLSEIDADLLATVMYDLETRGLNAIDPNRPVRPLGRSSIENYLKPLRGTLELAHRRGRISVNPFTQLLPGERPRRPERTRPHEWTDQEIASLLAASRQLAGGRGSKHDYSLLLRVAATIGLRLGEILGLQWQDFDPDDGFLTVARQWTTFGEYGPTKTAAGTRSIALPESLTQELRDHHQRTRYPAATDPIFPSRNGTPLSHRNVAQRGFRPAAALAGLDDVTFHSLRHAAASRLIQGGLDPVTVAHVLGHENPNVTLGIYAHLFNRRQTDVAIRAALAGPAAERKPPAS